MELFVPGILGAIWSATVSVPPIEAFEDSWRFSIEPRVWYVAPGGAFKMPGVSSGGDQKRLENVNLDSPRVSSFPAFRAERGPWWFSLEGVRFSTDREGFASSPFQLGDVRLDAGEGYRSSLDYASGEALVGYLVHASESDPSRLDLSVRGFGGVRFHDIDLRVAEVGGAETRADVFFAEPVIGARGDLRLYEKFGINMQVSGGFSPGETESSFSVDIIVGLSYRVRPWLEVLGGYRQLAFSFEDGREPDELVWRGAMAGIWLGVSGRF